MSCRFTYLIINQSQIYSYLMLLQIILHHCIWILKVSWASFIFHETNTETPLSFLSGKIKSYYSHVQRQIKKHVSKTRKETSIVYFYSFHWTFLSTYALVCVVTIFVKYNPRNSLDFYRSKGNYASIAIVKFGLQVCAMNIRYMSYPMINRESIDNVG